MEDVNHPSCHALTSASVITASGRTSRDRWMLLCANVKNTPTHICITFLPTPTGAPSVAQGDGRETETDRETVRDRERERGREESHISHQSGGRSEALHPLLTIYRPAGRVRRHWPQSYTYMIAGEAGGARWN